jgi:hypothetical protein
MHDKMMEAAMTVGQGNPGALNIVGAGSIT